MRQSKNLKKTSTEESSQKDLNGKTLDRAWFYGYKAAQGGLLEESNPFHHHSENYFLWVEGWWVGFYE